MLLQFYQLNILLSCHCTWRRKFFVTDFKMCCYCVGDRLCLPCQQIKLIIIVHFNVLQFFFLVENGILLTSSVEFTIIFLTHLCKFRVFFRSHNPIIYFFLIRHLNQHVINLVQLLLNCLILSVKVSKWNFL